MENYVVSRELAEKLKAAGYPQKAQFSHEPIGNDWAVMASHDCVLGRSIAAPLSDELLEQLPVRLNMPAGAHLQFDEYDKGHGMKHRYAYYYREAGMQPYPYMSADKPADALASLWLWCKEHNYV